MDVEERARQLQAAGPDEYPWGYYLYLAEQEARGPEAQSETVTIPDGLLVCSGCGVHAAKGTPGWRTTDASWCPTCAWLA